MALKRIEVYLKEDEVDGQVSSLKDRPVDSDGSEPVEGLGLDNATLTWNSITEAVKISQSKKQTSVDADNEGTTVFPISDASQAEPTQDRLFELQNVTVMFPERKMTVIMGPTASGKTALLVRCTTYRSARIDELVRPITGRWPSLVR